MKYVYLQTSGGIRKTEEAAAPPPNPTPSEGRWLMLVRGERPAFNPATELLNSNIVITETEFRINYSIVAKPAEVLQKAELEAERLSVKETVFVQNFIAMTPTTLTEYVEANVTDLASAKALLLQMAKMMLFLAKRTYGTD